MSQPLQKAVVHDLLGRINVAKVQYVDALILLTDTIDPADALFDFHGIPWQVVVYKQIGALKIQAFCRGIRTHKHIDFASQEPVLDRLPFNAAKPFALRLDVLAALAGISSNQHGRINLPKASDDILQRVVEACKDNCLPNSSACSPSSIENGQQFLHL